jgi:hypothetical protein
MKRMLTLLFFLLCVGAFATDGGKIPKDSKVFIAPMDGFETLLSG